LNVTRDTTLEQLQQQVKELFAVPNDLDWIYLDEENDVVTFSTEQEWRDALQLWADGKLLKITATPRPIQTKVMEAPHHHPHFTREDAPRGGCPFSRMSGACNNNTEGRCCASFPVRVGLPIALIIAVFMHPFLTLIGLVSLLFVTYHHFPTSFEKISLHAKAHWRKVAFAYALRFLLTCKCCTMLFAVPIGFLVYRKFKNCHSGNYTGNGQCCFVKIRDGFKQFLASHNINGCESAGKFMCSFAGGKRCPASQVTHVAPQQEVARVVQPQVYDIKQASAPLVTEIYPEASSFEQTILPQRTEPQPIQYAGELETLCLMGFDNKKLNEHLLRNFNGDLDRVITSLLQLSSMSK